MNIEKARTLSNYYRRRRDAGRLLTKAESDLVEVCDLAIELHEQLEQEPVAWVAGCFAAYESKRKEGTNTKLEDSMMSALIRGFAARSTGGEKDE